MISMTNDWDEKKEDDNKLTLFDKFILQFLSSRTSSNYQSCWPPPMMMMMLINVREAGYITRGYFSSKI